MKKIFFILFLSLATSVCAGDKGSLLLDDFQGAISGGPEGTVDFGAGNGSSIEATAATDIKHSGKQSLKVIYDAVSGGYMYVARGSALDARNAGWLAKPETIEWKNYSAISFYMYGSDSKAQVAFDLKDKGGEMLRFMVSDDFKGWKQVVCLFKDFVARSDWQPQNAEKNGTLDFPLQSYQFEPLPEAKGMLYFAQVELVKQ